MNTPIIPTSRIRNETMYSLIRVWIGFNEARMEIQVRVVVRTMRAIDSPSAPTLYWIPKIGIQA